MLDKTTADFKKDKESFVYEGLADKVKTNDHFLGLIAGAKTFDFGPPPSDLHARRSPSIIIKRNEETDNKTPLIVCGALVAPRGAIFANDQLFDFNVTLLTLGSIIVRSDETWSCKNENYPGLTINPIGDNRFKNGFIPKLFSPASRNDGSLNLSKGVWEVSTGIY
ncbi:MAG: hypothetical protein CR982_09010 [Candidatus Cloacimonadota bacterium]|nr:MAG: hypothetical protein CR982_09010 [Candidatus Cloacimonadota bacterium]